MPEEKFDTQTVKITINGRKSASRRQAGPSRDIRHGPFTRIEDDDDPIPKPTIVLADMSTLYSYGNLETGRAAIGAGAIFNNAVWQGADPLTANPGDTYGVDAPDPRVAGSVLDSNEALLYFLQREFGIGELIDRLWSDRYSTVRFYSLVGPGYPTFDPIAETEQGGPYFYYEYRTIPSRWPLPAGTLGALYGVTLGVSGGTNWEVGVSGRWRTRPPRIAGSGTVPDAPAYLAAEEYGYNDHDHGGIIGVREDEHPVPTIGYAADYWRAGQLQPASLPKRFNLNLTTDSIYYEPFDTADTENFKVTTEPTFGSAETTLPATTRFNSDIYAMLVAQWWHFTIGWTGYAVDEGSPETIPQQKRLRPFAPEASLGPGWDGAPGVLDIVRQYRYWMTVTTAAGESWPSLMSNEAIRYTDDGITPDDQVLIVMPEGLPLDPDACIERTLYRAEIDPGGEVTLEDVGALARLVNVFPDSGGGEEYFDNVILDADLGAFCPRAFPLPFGNAIEGDHFWTAVDLEDWSVGDPPDVYGAGFYWCSTAPGVDWTEWTFCASAGDPPDPPDPACFPCATLRSGSDQVTPSFEIKGFKQALIRPVFPALSAPYATSAFNPSWEHVLFFDAGEPGDGESVAFDCGGEDWTEEEAIYATDAYESLLIPAAGATTAQIRVLCAWAENSNPYDAYFTGDPSPYQTILFAAGDNVQPAYWTANGLLTVTRADTPAESLVAAISIDGQRRYIWRKTATTGRTAAIVTNAAYDSIQDRYTVSGFTGTEPQINRRFIRSSGDSPPS